MKAGSNQNPKSSFDNQRELADRERREVRGGDTNIIDGRYGFQERGARSGNAFYSRPKKAQGARNGGVRETGLYSDNMAIDQPPTGPRSMRQRAGR